MTPRPRLLAIMGSGETAPTMARVHRLLVERLGAPPGNAVLLDSPYGFQETLTRSRCARSAISGISRFRSTSRRGLPQTMCCAASGHWCGSTTPTRSSPARVARPTQLECGAELAVVGARDPRDIVAPFVEALLELREQARQKGSWTLADTLRDRLTAAGIEVRDTPLGVSWLLAGSPDTR